MKKLLAVLSLVSCFLFIAPSAFALVPYYVGTPSEPSEPYRNSKFYDALVEVELTGDMAYDILAVALSQVGYREGNSDDELHGESEWGSYDYNEYSYWWDGVANRGWCAAFVTWCARQAGISSSVLKGTLAANPVAYDLTLTPKAQATPKIADLVFFDWDLDGSSDHVGLVCKVTDDKILVVHGNYAERVTVTVFSRSQADLLGYARPDYPSAYFMGDIVSFMPSVNCGYNYQEGEYFRKLLSVEKTGSPATDIASVAISQVGYRAGTSSSEYHGTPSSAETGTYTEFGRWYGTLPYADDWGAAFTLWCARQAGITSDIIYGSAIPNPNNLKLEFSEDREVISSRVGIGDIAFFTWPFTSYTWDNCGIVTGIDKDGITVVIGTIETGEVEKLTFAFTDSSLKAVGFPDYAVAAQNAVFFDASGGACDTEKIYLSAGEPFAALPDCEREGYVFDGWYLENEKITAQTYFSGGNVTLTARWRLPEFSVVFDTSGRCESPEDITVVKGSAVGKLPVLSLSGYVFDGWFTEREGGEAVDESFVITEHTVLYARFSVICGDVDSDGAVSLVDAAIIARYLAGWEGYADVINIEAADVDGDGTPATLRDVAVIERHIARWGGYEVLPIE